MTKMNKSKVFWTGYLTLAALFAVYGNIWGETHYKSFAYNVGRGLVWPVILVPALGNIIGAIVLVVVIIAILVLVKS